LAEASPNEASSEDGSDRTIDRMETRWLLAMLLVLGVMMGVLVVSSVAHGLHPPSHIEPIDPMTLHLQGEFVESNLGTAIEPDGSATVRVIAQQYGFVPDCLRVPAGTPLKIRLTSPDVMHGFMVADTNVNTMVVPGFVAEVRTRFTTPGNYTIPCHEFCGLGHHAMWARLTVVPKDQFPHLSALQRVSCARQ
jgi:cytochrome c oxidase subunit 2